MRERARACGRISAGACSHALRDDARPAQSNTGDSTPNTSMQLGARRRIATTLSSGKMYLRRQTYNAGFGKPERMSFLFAGIGVDASPTAKMPGNACLELLGINLHRTALNVEAPFGNWARDGRQTEERQQIVQRQAACHAVKVRRLSPLSARPSASEAPWPAR